MLLCLSMHKKQTKKLYSRFRRPSRTLYTKSWNAKSTAGRVGKCDRVFGWAGTICNCTCPDFLLPGIKILLAQLSWTIFSYFFQLLNSHKYCLRWGFCSLSSFRSNFYDLTFVYWWQYNNWLHRLLKRIRIIHGNECRMWK